MEKKTERLECQPIKSFEELLAFEGFQYENGESKRLNAEVNSSDQGQGQGSRPASLPVKGTPYPGQRVVPLNRNFSDERVTLDGRRIPAKDCPRTLVCHDFKGGYLDDKYACGSDNHENYVFRHWPQTDIFCYFSHHFVTIPPLGWINAGHSHGVKVIGTIITEWDDGKKLCQDILKDSSSIQKTAEKLSQLARFYGFDGYLVNIENELEKEQVPKMVEFLQKLKEASGPDCFIIWYDSVTVNGDLKWQDALNDLNEIFFNACDGIYLNYGWNDEKLSSSVEKAGKRKLDVYVGVDVFGRGCFGGGGVNTFQALEKIHAHQLSCAIFAPGWSFECNPYDSFHHFDDALWIPCSQYFYFKCLKDGFHPTDKLDLLSPNCTSTAKKFKVFFSTDFSLGYGTSCFRVGQKPISQPWFDMNRQSFQPVLSLTSGPSGYDETKKEKVRFDASVGFSGGGSLQLINNKRSQNYENPLKFCPIWYPLHIPFSKDRTSIAVLAAWKSASVTDELKICLELFQKNGQQQTKKILLGSVEHLAASIAGKYYIHLKLSHFLQEYEGVSTLDNGKEVEFYFRKNNYDEKEIFGWRISCFLFDVDEVQLRKLGGISGIRVGAEGEVSLGFLSLGQIIHYTELEGKE